MILIELPVKDMQDLFDEDPVVRGQRIAEITTSHSQSSYGVPVILFNKEVFDVPNDSTIRPLPKGFCRNSSSKDEIEMAKNYVVAARRAGRNITFMPTLTKEDLKEIYAWQILEKKLKKRR